MIGLIEAAVVCGVTLFFTLDARKANRSWLT
jgi:hypothetical protein